MQTVCTWDGKMHFTSAFGEHAVAMDARAPLGTGKAPSPKQMVLAGICGCTGIDVAGLLRKHKQEPASFVIEAKAAQTTGEPPTVFKMVHLVYKTTGKVDPAVLLDAVEQSMTKHCGVSAMIAKACPITYDVEHEGKRVGSGAARFP